MARVGGDIEQLSRLKATFDRESQNIQELTSSLSGTLESTWWIGPHADKFRSEWQGEFAPTLGRLQTTLQQLGVEIEAKRQQLEQAGA